MADRHTSGMSALVLNGREAKRTAPYAERAKAAQGRIERQRDSPCRHAAARGGVPAYRQIAGIVSRMPAGIGAEPQKESIQSFSFLNA